MTDTDNNNKFQIEITKDVGNTPADSHNMSLKAVKALNVVMEQLVIIADNSKFDDNDIRFDAGTTKIALQTSAEKLKYIEQNLTEASEGKLQNPEISKAWNKVHQTISSNGLHYNATITFQNKETDLNPIFNDKKKFKAPKVLAEQTQIIRFCLGKVKGMMENVKNSTLHLEINSATVPLKFTCSESEIDELSKLYKKKVFLSLWEIKKGDKVLRHEYCDNYSQDLYEDLLDFHNKFKGLSGVDRLKFLYKKINIAINQDDLDKVNRILKLFIYNDEVSVNRMILNALKQIDNEESISFMKEKIIKKIEDVIGAIN